MLLFGGGWYTALQLSYRPPISPHSATTTEDKTILSEPEIDLPDSIPSIVQHDSELTPPPFRIVLPTPLSDADRLQYLAGAFEAGQTSGPDIAIAKAMLSTPAAQATARWLLARSGTPLPFQFYADFQKTYPDWPTGSMLRRKAEIALLTSQKPDAAVRKLFSESPPETTIGKILWSRMLLNDGEKQKALELIRPVWRNEKLMPATEQQIRTDFAKLLSEEDHRARMIFLMGGKNWDSALLCAKSAGPGAEEIVNARMAAVQNAKNAQAQLDAVRKESQGDPLVLLTRLLLANRQDKHKEAGKIVVRLTDSAGKKDSRNLSEIECRDWRIQQRVTIRELLDEKAFPEAYETAAAELSKLGCNHADADFLAGWIALRMLGKPNKAKDHFDALAKNAESASQKARAAYWQGRVWEQQGDKTAASESYERAARHWTTFYGQLAAEKQTSGLSPESDKISVTPEIRSSLDAMTPIQAIRLLDESGATDISIPIYADLAVAFPDKPYLEALAVLAEEQRNPRAVLTVARIAARRGFDLGGRAYPTFGMPEAPDKGWRAETPLLYAIAHQESAFNPKARSHAGALGLMQLMPETARTTAARSGTAFDANRLTSDPAYNAELGAAHLKDLLSDWNGSLILTFAAYNAGGGNVRKWIAAHGDPRSPDVDAIDWIERIPFQETRHYVQRISENLTVYRKLMNDRQPSLFSREVTTLSGRAPKTPTATP